MSTPADSSFYTPHMCDDDYVTWADTYFPMTDWSSGAGQCEPSSENFQTESWSGVLQDTALQNCGSIDDMNTWNGPPPMMMCGVESQNDSLNCAVESIVEQREQPNLRLEAEIAKLNVIVEKRTKRIEELEAQFDAFQEWTAQVSRVVNDIQLKQEGLSPLRKQFGYVMGSPAKKSKGHSRERKPDPKTRDGKRDADT